MLAWQGFDGHHASGYFSARLRCFVQDAVRRDGCFECCSGLGLSRALVVGMVKLVWVESAALGWAFLFLFWWEMMVWLLRG